MSLEESESRSFAEILAEETERDISEFQPPEDIEMPSLDELNEYDAEEFYDED